MFEAVWRLYVWSMDVDAVVVLSDCLLYGGDTLLCCDWASPPSEPVSFDTPSVASSKSDLTSSSGVLQENAMGLRHNAVPKLVRY